MTQSGPRDTSSIAEMDHAIAVREDCPAWIAIGDIRVQCQVGKLEVNGHLHREHFGKLPTARATKVAQTLDETDSSIAWRRRRRLAKELRRTWK